MLTRPQVQRYTAECRVGLSAIDVIYPVDVGEKDAGEFSPLKETREIDPILEILIGRRLVPRVGPQARRLTREAIHVEGVKRNCPVLRQRLNGQIVVTLPTKAR